MIPLDEEVYRRDPVYGLITISAIADVIINLPEFKRLSNIRQLGASDIIFPFAGHRRYEHSINVGALARRTAKKLRETNPHITDRDVVRVELAGDLHDIGHAPFSHVFDDMLENMYDQKESKLVIRHEERSQIIAAYLIRKTANLTGLDENDIKKIQEYIEPPAESDDPLGQIVNNRIHRVDVDKMDYIIRDGMYLRYDQLLSQVINITEILDRSRIVNGVWMFDVRDYGKIYDLVCRRLIFHTNSYSLPSVSASSYLISQILLAFHRVNPEYFECLKLENEDDFTAFTKMDDTILEYIMNQKDSKYEHIKKMIVELFNHKLPRHVGDYTQKMLEIDDENYIQVPWKVYSDKSAPLNMLPLIQYHKGGVHIDVLKNPQIYRLFDKREK